MPLMLDAAQAMRLTQVLSSGAASSFLPFPIIMRPPQNGLGTQQTITTVQCWWAPGTIIGSAGCNHLAAGNHKCTAPTCLHSSNEMAVYAGMGNVQQYAEAFKWLVATLLCPSFAELCLRNVLMCCKLLFLSFPLAAAPSVCHAMSLSVACAPFLTRQKNACLLKVLKTLHKKLQLLLPCPLRIEKLHAVRCTPKQRLLPCPLPTEKLHAIGCTQKQPCPLRTEKLHAIRCTQKQRLLPYPLDALKITAFCLAQCAQKN